VRSHRARLGAVLVAVALAACGLTAVSAMAAGGEAHAGRTVTVRAMDGDLLASAPLRGDRFAVSYRNSIYGTLAEERYLVSTDGRFRVVELAADQLAVLEEYYAVPGPPRRAGEADRRTWVAEPAHAAAFTDLAIAATELGERTLLVPGSPPVPLPPLVPDDHPTVVLDIEESP
jgi:hypothetical protein